MSLYKAMRKRGYTFRQHLEEVSWGWHEPNVVDMDRLHADAFDIGRVEGLKAYMETLLYRPPWGLWTFPSFDIEKPLPRRSEIHLAKSGRPFAIVVAPLADAELRMLAEAWIAQVHNRHGIQLPLRDDDVTPELMAENDLIVFGGGHRNRLALKLAMRCRTLFVDAGVPGDDGWVFSTHCGLHASGNNVLQASAPKEHYDIVLTLLDDNIVASGNNLVLKYVHRIYHGAMMKEHFPAWESFTAALLNRIIQLRGKSVTMPEDIHALSELLAVGFDSGGFEKGIYNVAPVDIANDCAFYYQVSGDERALQLFREMLFRLADHYLKTPGGGDYPADLDFRLGLLILNFARFEHTRAFDEDDRLFLANLLLACARSVYEFSFKFWPAGKCGSARHNHQTFPAISLLYAADYFSRFDLPYVADWRQYAEDMFSGDLWRRGKQIENSRSYEPFVFEHAAAYSLFTGRGLSLFKGDCFEKMVRRQIVATDNFFRQVDYGDTAITLNPVDSVSARMLATQQDGVIRWFAGEGFFRRPSYVTASPHNYPGLRMPHSSTPPPAGDWEYLPVDKEFVEQVCPELSPGFAFDKLAFRTGWGDDDHYLLLEGIGGKVSHAHKDTNGIVRLNHLGRHWIVSNGYGKRPGIDNVNKSFSSRELGPVDHNMLVLHRNDAVVCDLPMAALLQRGRQDNLLYATSALLDYGGINWFRTLVILSGQYVLVLDRIQVVKDGLQKAHVEWNCLGEASSVDGGFRLAQNGVFMDVISSSKLQVEHLPANQSACWKNLLAARSVPKKRVTRISPSRASAKYPHAEFPLAKLVFHIPPPGVGQTIYLDTLLVASRGRPEFTVGRTEPGRIVIYGMHTGKSQIQDRDLKISVSREQCDVCFSDLPDII